MPPRVQLRVPKNDQEGEGEVLFKKDLCSLSSKRYKRTKAKKRITQKQKNWWANKRRHICEQSKRGKDGKRMAMCYIFEVEAQCAAIGGPICSRWPQCHNQFDEIDLFTETKSFSTWKQRERSKRACSKAYHWPRDMLQGTSEKSRSGNRDY